MLDIIRHSLLENVTHLLRLFIQHPKRNLHRRKRSFLIACLNSNNHFMLKGMRNSVTSEDHVGVAVEYASESMSDRMIFQPNRENSRLFLSKIWLIVNAPNVTVKV